jgi:hypothetical protein
LFAFWELGWEEALTLACTIVVLRGLVPILGALGMRREQCRRVP